MPCSLESTARVGDGADGGRNTAVSVKWMGTVPKVLLIHQSKKRDNSKVGREL